MGGLSLTNPGLQYDAGQGTDPSTGMSVQLPPIVKFFKNAALRGHQAALDEMSTVQPGRSDITAANGGPVTLDSETGKEVPSTVTETPATSKMPKFFQPSFSQTTRDANGLPLPVSPAETKLGKLVHILAAAGQGALAGWGTGNPGAGAAAARNVPFEEAQQRQTLAHEQAQTDLTRSQSQMVQTPYGPMPAGMAKLIFPALARAGGTVAAAQIGATSRENVAETGATSRENVADTAAQSRKDVAQTNKRFMAVPGVGLLDTQDSSGKPTLVPGSAQGITLTQQHLDDYGLPQEFLGKTMTLPQLAQLERAQAQQNVPVQGAAGPALVNRKTAKVTPLGLGSPGVATALARPIQIGDIDNPGQTKITSAGQAIAQGAPGTQSASIAVPKKAAEAEVPTKIGDQKVAFTTMIQHAQLLRDAAKALSNGDVQTLSGLRNAFKNEFGYAGPITAAAIADAYKGEVSNVINKGHITDTGNEKIAHTLDPIKQNYKTVDSVLGAYQALAQSKMNMLNKQVQSAIRKSQPNAPATAVPAVAPNATHIFVPGKGLQPTAPVGQ